MHDFVLKEIKYSDIKKELNDVGFDKTYVHKACEKYDYKNLKIYKLTLPQANILKQTAISVGCDCAIHREVITAKIEYSDCILGGSISQLKKISEKLKHQPFGLKNLADEIERIISFRKYDGTKIVGILNLTENSFSDGGLYNDLESAKERLIEMINEGADLIDIGAESTKPYSKSVSTERQLEKLIPVIEYAKDKISISVDTRSAEVAEKCIQAGAKIINDVSGLEYDLKMAETLAKYDIKVIIQHSKGTPENMQDNPEYENLTDEIFSDLKQRIDFAISKGIKKENIIIDPGIGFGKTKENNFEIIKRVEELYGLGCPVMLGLSRKSLLGIHNDDNFEKDIFTVALNSLAIERKVDYIRVHNVKLHKKLISLLEFF